MDGSRRGRSSFTFNELQVEEWPSVRSEILPEAVQANYERRKSAITCYASGEKVKDVATRFGLSIQFITKMFNRCMQPHPDGNIWGFRALIPYVHVKQYQRKECASVGAGSFSKLLIDHPQIKHDLTSAFFGRPDSRLSSNRISKDAYFYFFKKLCVEAGIQKHEYPFNTVCHAKRSLYKYLDFLGTCKEGIMATADSDARRHLSLGDGVNIFSKGNRPYRRVAFDGHSVDSCWAFFFENAQGKRFEVVLERFWLLLVLDENSGAVLGYSTSVRKNYNRIDVMKAISDALNPEAKQIVTPQNLVIPRGEGSESIRTMRELQWNIWEEFVFDNDKANISFDVTRTLHRIGCRVNAGPVAFPEKRAILERFFETLEKANFRILPGSLGTGPGDPVRQLAEKYAVAYRLTFEDLLFSLEEAITFYNQRGMHRNYYMSPLQVLLGYAINSDTILIRVDESLRDNLSRLGPLFTPTVRGNQSEGVRPYVTVLGEPYSSEVLGARWELIGKKLSCFLQADARYVDAYDVNGFAVGILNIRSHWRDFPHSYETRTLVMAKKAYLNTEEADLINPAIEINLALKSRTGRKSATRAAMAITEDKKLLVPIVTKHELKAPALKDTDLKEAYRLKGRVIGEGSNDE